MKVFWLTFFTKKVSNYPIKSRKTSFLAILISFLVLISCHGKPVYPQNLIENNIQPVKTIEVKVTNFGKVDDNYYRGSKLRISDYELLFNLGIKSIINLRLQYRKDLTEREMAKKYSMKYFEIPLNPLLLPKSKQIDKFFKILENPDNLPVYVHCSMGEDRTGLMTAIYRIKKYDWDFDQAYSEMLKYNFHKHLYFYYKKFLRNYRESIKGCIK